MRLPEFLYTPHATANLVPIYVGRNISLSAAAAGLNVQTNPVPAEYVFCLAHWAWRGVPGAAQVYLGGQLDIHDRATSPAVTMLAYKRPPRTPLAATEPWGETETPGVWLMPGHLLSLAIDFSAGANANEARLSYSGWLIPRGNVQFGGF